MRRRRACLRERLVREAVGRDPARARVLPSALCLAAGSTTMLALLAEGGRPPVAQLMVRNLEEAVVRALKTRAARRNHSAEQEHREILELALLHPRRRTLAEVLAAIPGVGNDPDFARDQSDRRG
jgi:plasmid stability protein